jgi:hypothetical protein
MAVIFLLLIFLSFFFLALLVQPLSLSVVSYYLSSLTVLAANNSDPHKSSYFNT